MAKKTTNIFSDPNSVFSGLNAAFTQKSLMPVVTSDRSAMLGIQVPSLALQYLLGTTRIPFSRMVQIVGSEGSYKSTFMYEMLSWYIDQGGYAVIIETEAKDSGDTRNAVLNWDIDRLNRVAAVSVTDSTAWMSAVTATLLHYKDAMTKAHSYVPIFVGLDSVTATASSASMASIDKEGYASGSFPTLARDLSEYFKVMPSRVHNLPFTFSWINHVKPGTDSSMYSRGKIPGGKALAYYNSLTLHLGKKKTTESASGTVTSTLELSTWKNSWGRDGRKIDVDVVWYHSDNDAMPIRCMFDWGTADIKFLLKLCDGTDCGAATRDKIKSIIDLRPCKVGVKPGVYSSVLGIDKEDPKTYSEAGAILATKADLLQQIQEALYIKQIPGFNAGDDYLQALEAARNNNHNMIKNRGFGVKPEEDNLEEPVVIDEPEEEDIDEQ